MVRERADRLLNDLLDAATLGSFDSGAGAARRGGRPRPRATGTAASREAQHGQQRHQRSPGLSRTAPATRRSTAASERRGRRRSGRCDPGAGGVAPRPRARLRATTRLASTWCARRSRRAASRDPELLRAFSTVPRELFVESGAPYGDQALPIDQGQTISQPYVVAFHDRCRPSTHPRRLARGEGPGDRHRQRLPGGHPVGAGRRAHQRRAPCRPERARQGGAAPRRVTRTCGWSWATGREAPRRTRRTTR